MCFFTVVWYIFIVLKFLFIFNVILFFLIIVKFFFSFLVIKLTLIIILLFIICLELDFGLLICFLKLVLFGLLNFLRFFILEVKYWDSDFVDEEDKVRSFLGVFIFIFECDVFGILELYLK